MVKENIGRDLQVSKGYNDPKDEEEPKSPRDIRAMRVPHLHRKRRSEVFAADHLALFRDDKLAASGEVTLRTSYVKPSKKFWAELRNSTMVVFKSQRCAHNPAIRLKDVVTVISMQEVKVSFVKRGLRHNIYLSGPGCGGIKPLVIKVRWPDHYERWKSAIECAVSESVPGLSDLHINSIIGMGGGGRVFLTVLQPSGDIFALKAISKDQAFRSTSALRSVVNERKLMKLVKPHPFILELMFSFQTDANFFVGTPFCVYGDLATWVNKQPGRKLDEETVRLISAEILLGLQHLHHCGIVYRDLKPENVFIGQDGHVKIGDFGLAKRLRSPSGPDSSTFRTTSVCGTRDYIPPEMITRKNYAFEVDMWTFGVMLYRLLVGTMPFRGNSTSSLFRSIKKGTFKVPLSFDKDTMSLLRGLLRPSKSSRLKPEQVRRHPFFSDICWKKILQKGYGPVVKNLEPVKTESDLMANFDRGKLSQVSIGEHSYNSLSDGHIKGCVRLYKRLPGFEYCRLSENFGRKGKGTFTTVELLQKISSGSTEWCD